MSESEKFEAAKFKPGQSGNPAGKVKGTVGHANGAAARVPITESGGGRGGSGWPQGNGTVREGSLQADSPLAGARSRSDGCCGGQSVSRRTPDGVSVSAPKVTGAASEMLKGSVK